MTKKEIIRMVAGDTGYSLTVVNKVVEALWENITSELAKGSSIRFSRFGIFDVKKRNERTGRNPLTGKMIPIPSKVIPYFKPGEHLCKVVMMGVGIGEKE